jgi:hypothetical protein
MRRRLIVAAIALSAITPALATAQHFTSNDKITKVSAPEILDTTGMFQTRIARVGDDIFVGGQPTEKALREMRAQGVTTLVNLRTPQEMTRSVKFDEPALAAQLGMKYVYLPVRGDTTYPYSRPSAALGATRPTEAKHRTTAACTGW